MEAPESTQDILDVELKADKLEIIFQEEFVDGSLLRCTTIDGKEIFSLRKNPPGNILNGGHGRTGGITYSLMLSSGYEVLLQLPIRFSSRFFCELKHNELSKYNADFLEKAFLKVFPQNFTLEINSDKDPIQMMSLEKPALYSILKPLPQAADSEPIHMSERGGEQKVINTLINGGRKLCLATFRCLGVNEKYADANEDFIGVNVENGRIAGADGVGSYGHGELASAVSVEGFLKGEGSLKDAVVEGYERLYALNRYLSISGRLQHSDSILCAIQLDGDSFEAATLGDCRWMLVRNGRIFDDSKIGSVVGREYQLGSISLQAALNHTEKHHVTSSMAGNFEPDYRKHKLQPGDKLFLFDDGNALTDEEIVELAKNTQEPAEAVLRWQLKTAERNMQVKYVLEDKHGISFTAPSPRDNAFFGAYYH